MRKLPCTLLLTLYVLHFTLLSCLYAFNVRPDSMGSAGVSVADDLSSIRLNPAGLTLFEENQLAMNVGYKEGNFLGADYTHIIKSLGVVGGYLGGNFTGARKYFLGGAIGRDEEIAEISLNFSWGARLGIISEQKSTSIDLGGGVKYKLKGYNLGLGIYELFSRGRRAQLGVSRRFDDYLVALDIDTNSKIYLGGERGVYGHLGRVRVGINTREKTITAGLSAYLWPYGLDVFYALPWDFKSAGGFAFSFIYRFGGYDFSQVVLNKNTEKAVSLERKIVELKTNINILKKELAEMEDACKKAQDFLDILESESSELIKKQLKILKSIEAQPSTEVTPKSIVKPRPKEVIALPTKHKVSQGDSLRSIAQYYYNDANKWQIIYNANRDKIERGMPKIGAELVIPKP